MRPMKLAGDQLLFGRGCLQHLRTMTGKRAVVVTGGSSMSRSGMLQKVRDYLSEAGIESVVFSGVEPDPSFDTVRRGAERMKEYGPDWIVAVGGGSAMDAAKAMWIYYEHPELSRLEDILPPAPFPKLRRKAHMVCIPSTSGTASEVSRSIVITDERTKLKHGIGNMEMMPDIALCDPEVTATMPPAITAETGMDALTHALEALVSKRANYISHILSVAAARDIIAYLPRAFRDGGNMEWREAMMNASMTAGLAFTNVSLGIVHSTAHTIGGLFGIAHGLANAILLPVIIRFNSSDPDARLLYAEMAREAGIDDLVATVGALNGELGIPKNLGELIADRRRYDDRLDEMAALALKDGCTKTNPIIPDAATMKRLFLEAYGDGAKRKE
jgi:alcohol dehydrogenase class IV